MDTYQKKIDRYEACIEEYIAYSELNYEQEAHYRAMFETVSDHVANLGTRRAEPIVRALAVAYQERTNELFETAPVDRFGNKELDDFTSCRYFTEALNIALHELRCLNIDP